ncbi:MAG: hypothetical protein AAFY82_00690 [Pseudomonadota bacterium]
MSLIWWIVPALAGIVGLLLSFAGIGRLMKLRLAAGGLRFLFGIGFLGAAGLTVLAGLNLQTYQALTKERDVAELVFAQAPDAEDQYTLTMTLPDGKIIRQDGFIGDEFQVSAQVIRFSPMKQLLGYESLYRLEYIESRYARRFSSTELSTSTSYGRRVSDDGKVELFDQEIGFDVYGALVNYGGEAEIDQVIAPGKAGEDSEESPADGSQNLFSAGLLTSKDAGGSAPFGSAVYFPMGDQLKYKVRITQSALVVEPLDNRTRQRMMSGS